MDRLAIVVPCYNEEEVLKLASKALRDVLEDLVQKGKVAEDSFILFVNDGSRDRTWELIEEEHAAYPVRVRGVKLAGNVGHQFALTAGLVTAKDMSDVTISIDADLQDDVDVIEEMVDKFHAGNDIVYGVRKERRTDTFFKRTSAQAFYKLMHLMGVKTVYNHADFRLMSRRAVEEFSKYKETNLFLRGMMPLIGYRTDSVYYDRKERAAGESKYPLKKMLALAFNGISSFSVKPISLILSLGLFVIFISVIMLIYALFSYFSGHVVPGWTSLIVSVWFLGGLQLLAIGMVGLYIGKIYMEVKQRPRYNIEKILSGEELPSGQGATEENMAYLRERYSGELSWVERVDMLNTMMDMGVITREQRNSAYGDDTVVLTPDMTQAEITATIEAHRKNDPWNQDWNVYFSEDPVNTFKTADDVFSWLGQVLDGEK